MARELRKWTAVILAAMLCQVSCSYYERTYWGPYERIVRYYPDHSVEVVYRNVNNLRIRHYLTRAESRGRGSYRLLSPSDAELQCHFPDREEIVSNIVWVRADFRSPEIRELYRTHNARNDVLHNSKGSTLYLYRVTSLDVGLYRCIATARIPGTGITYTVYQDVEFYPKV